MTKLPMIRSGLPVKSRQGKAPVKKDFDQALATLRKASGKPEFRLVPLRCAVHDRPFVVIYRRDDPAEQFRIDRIAKEAPAQAAGGGMIGRFLAGENGSLAEYDGRDFNSAGRHCPWCQARGTVVHCEDCGETYCSGTITVDGNGARTYYCVPRCGSDGTLTDYDKMHGKRGAPQPQENQSSLLAKSKKKAALPPPLKRLPAPKRLMLPNK